LQKRELSRRRHNLAKLLEFLRPFLAKEVPVYLSRVSGLTDGNESDALDLIVQGIVPTSHSYWTWHPPKMDALILSSYQYGAIDGLKQLEQIAEEFEKRIRPVFGSGALHIEFENAFHKYSFLAMMVQVLTRNIRIWYPESPLLPDFVEGTVAFKEIEGYTPAMHPLVLPTKVVYDDLTADGAKWLNAQNSMKGKTISIWTLKTPLLLSLTRLVFLLAENAEQGLTRVVETEQSSLIRRNAARLAIGGPDDNPTIDGQKVPTLTPTEYRVVKCLVDSRVAGLPRLTSPDLDKQSKTTDAHKVLRRLLNRHKLWKAVIRFPERKGMGYGVA
jgi:hypothetical protein